MSITPDGIQSAADREDKLFRLNPKTSEPYTAWQRRAATIEAVVAAVNDHEARLAALEAQPASVPFPAGS